MHTASASLSDLHCLQVLESLSHSAPGRARINSALPLCDNSHVASHSAVLQLRDWLSSAWDYLAMGDFPYPSSYMLNGNGELPAYPMRVACEELKEEGMEDEELLTGERGVTHLLGNV